MLVHNILNKIYYRQIRQKIRQNTQRLTFRIPQKTSVKQKLFFDGFERENLQCRNKKQAPNGAWLHFFGAVTTSSPMTLSSMYSSVH